MSANVSGSGNAPMSPADSVLVMTRFFDAPRELVFSAWTETEHLQQWQSAPMGFTVTTEKSDIRPGGSFRVCMHAPDGTDHWLQGVYKEVVPPERLVFTHCWLDAAGKPGKETLVTITLAERGDRTELTLHQTGFASVESRNGHNVGWTSTFDRLAGYLASVNTQPSKPQQAQS